MELNTAILATSAVLLVGVVAVRAFARAGLPSLLLYLALGLVLGEGGFISITVAVDANTGRAISPPKLSGRGFSDDPKALDAVLPMVEDDLSRTESEGITDTHRIAQAVRRVVGKWVGETYCRRPMIVPTVIAV